MKKSEVSKLLHSLEIPVNEGITSKENMNKSPRIVYWVYIEQDKMASGNEYTNLQTIQISFFAMTPGHEKMKELRRILREKGLHPVFYHEYIENDPVFSKTWHTYFSLEVDDDTEMM